MEAGSTPPRSSSAGTSAIPKRTLPKAGCCRLHTNIPKNSRGAKLISSAPPWRAALFCPCSGKNRMWWPRGSTWITKREMCLSIIFRNWGGFFSTAGSLKAVSATTWPSAAIGNTVSGSTSASTGPSLWTGAMSSTISKASDFPKPNTLGEWACATMCRPATFFWHAWTAAIPRKAFSSTSPSTTRSSRIWYNSCPPIMNLFIETLGCQMNTADSEEMADALLKKGARLTQERAKADVVILNTCTVRDHAEQKALSYLGRLKDWKKENHDRVLIVAGCAAERMKKSLKHRFPHVDLVVGAKRIQDFPDVIDNFFKTRNFDWFAESEESFDGAKLRTEGVTLVLGQ